MPIVCCCTCGKYIPIILAHAQGTVVEHEDEADFYCLPCYMAVMSGALASVAQEVVPASGWWS
jgi:hypothetical protein